MTTEEIRQLQEKFAHDPQDQRAFDGLVNHYKAQNAWKPLAQVYVGFGQHLDEEAAKAHFLTLTQEIVGIIGVLQAGKPSDEDKASVGAAMVELGDLYFHRLNMRDEAMTMYQRSFKAWSNDTTCLERARDVYWQDGDFDRVLVLLGLELRVHKMLGDEGSQATVQRLISQAQSIKLHGQAEPMVKVEVEAAKNVEREDAPESVQTLMARAHNEQRLDQLIDALTSALAAPANHPESYSRYANDEPLKRAIQDTILHIEELAQTSPVDAAKLLLRTCRFELASVRSASTLK